MTDQLQREGAPKAKSAAEIVDEYLRLLMLPDPIAARRYTSPDLQIRFTGGREMRDPAECTVFNAQRYAWVKKRIEKTETVDNGQSDEQIVYSLGTLYGAWPDGRIFEGNRYVDRYVLRDGLIVAMDVWNDSAEWLLTHLHETHLQETHLQVTA